MAPMIPHAVIVQVAARQLIFRRCSTCKGKLVGCAQNHELRTAGVMYFCVECGDDATTFLANYHLEMIVSVSNGEKVKKATAYDKAVELLLGCSADKLSELLVKDPKLVDDIEEMLLGLRCHLIIRQDKKKKKKNAKAKAVDSTTIDVEAIIPADPRFKPMFATLDQD
ncbi:hypothetical protein BJV82DRAFT_206612 [Fennellomyces sp. T-0311]|nr:hypothetical protein BJV82DRAFT_206612 [Fennellomyces sp. T-0311]